MRCKDCDIGNKLKIMYANFLNKHNDPLEDMSLSLYKRLTMPLADLEVYCRAQRKKQFEQGKKPKRIRFREVCYPVFRLLLTVDRLFRKQTVTLLSPLPKYKDRVIFACTHIFENDVENIYEKLGRGCWWFIGDPRFMYRDISGLFAYLNGVIFLDTDDKEDRRIAYLRSMELLKAGGSLMIFPEGARNGTENLPVMPLFPGTAKMALETGTPIIPVAIEQFGKRFIINFGNQLRPRDFSNTAELTQTLRDTMATLKWSIWEMEGIQDRLSLPDDYAKQFRALFEQKIHPYDTPETIEKTRFHTEAEIEQRDAFSHLERLIPRRENAFLFSKK